MSNRKIHSWPLSDGWNHEKLNQQQTFTEAKILNVISLISDFNVSQPTENTSKWVNI